MFICRWNDTEEKSYQKEGYGRRLVTVSFCIWIIVSVLVQYLYRVAQHFKIDVVHLDTLLKESVNRKN